MKKPMGFKLKVDDFGFVSGSWDGERPQTITVGDVIHVREVIPDSVIVTRKQLEKAWNETAWVPKPANKKEMFYQFCRALGLDEP